MADAPPSTQSKWIAADEGLLLRLNGTRWAARVRRVIGGSRWAVLIVRRDPKEGECEMWSTPDDPEPFA